MLRYETLSQKPRRFLSMTGYTVEEFDALLPSFKFCFEQQMQTHTLENQPRTHRRYTSYRNSPLPTIQDKLLFILVYLKQATTQEVHAILFAMSQPKANQWIHLLLPLLEEALALQGELPPRTPEAQSLSEELEQFFFHDGTERPINRPKDSGSQKTYYSGKKKQHTLKNNIVINAGCKIWFLTDTCEGKKHDKKVADEAGYTFPEGSTLYQDTGFQGYRPEGVVVMQPTKKPRGGQLTDAEKSINQAISSIRIRVEHAIGGVKRYRIVKDKLRLWKQGVRDRLMLIACGLHNFRLNFRPWNYSNNAP